MNLNKITQSRQRKLMAIILGGIVLGVGLLFLINRQMSGHKAEKHDSSVTTAAEPDLTGGAVTNSFDGKGQNSVLMDAQRREQDARDNLSKMQKQFDDLKKQVSDSNASNEGLKQQVSTLTQLLQDQQNRAKSQGAVPGGTTVQQGYVPPQTAYTLSAPAVQTGQIDNTQLDYSSFDAKPKDTSFWVPTGTFSDAIVLEGADANASVRGENNLVPMQFKLKGVAHMPGNTRLANLDNCFVTAAAYGDISSERALVQLQRLSCVIDGKHIDQAVKGHVSFYGKNGIKGVPVMRNGKILGLAFTAGALGGLGSSVSQVGQTVTGVGATSSISGGEVARGAIGGGVSKAADKLADYYIERAEQYHPIIPVGAANRVEVVFIEGFRAKFIEDEDLAKAAKQNVQNVSETATRAVGNSGLPPDLVGKLGDATSLNMNDFVTPSGGRPGAAPQGSTPGSTPQREN